MGPPSGRRSTRDSRVTLYKPPAPPPPVAGSAPAGTSSRKRTRSSALTSDGDGDLVLGLDDEKPLLTKTKKSPSPRKPTPFKVSLDRAHPPPKAWDQQYEIIRRQRESLVAPVDTMGCEQGGRDREEAPPSDKDNRLSILVSLMLSSQTKDPVTHQAVQNLRKNLPGGLTLDSLLAASVEELDTLISKVGFHQTKATNLAKLAVRLRDLHGGEVPEDLPSLLAINGVGPKMSILFLQAIGINAGIGVDVHVHRITNRLGWHKPATSTPEQTRLNLESWLPKSLHPKINLMLVGFGQTICKPVGPRCDLCDVGAAKLCPSRRVVPPSKSSASKDKAEVKRRKVEDGLPKVEVMVEGLEVGDKRDEGADAKPDEAAPKVEEAEVVVKEELVW